LSFGRLVPIAAHDRRFLPDLREGLVRELYRRGLATSLLFFPIAWLLQRIVADAAARSPTVRWSFVAVYAALGLRLALVLLERGSLGGRLTTNQRFALFTFGTALLGGVLAALNFLAYSHLTPIAVALLSVWQAGVNSLGMMSLAGSRIPYFLFMLPNVGSLVLLAGLDPKPGLGTPYLLLMLVYLVGLAVIAQIVHTSLRDNLLLGLKLRELTLEDEPTGLRNRRFLAEIMPGEAELVLRGWRQRTLDGAGAQPASIGLLMIDLDHFKSINDTHGHAAGDAALHQFAALLRTSILRRSDHAIRWGGEEVVVVATGTERPPRLLAERIRLSIERHTFRLPSGEPLRITCSVGYSVFPFDAARPEAVRWEEVLEIADRALYLAKRTGRNRVVGIGSGPQGTVSPQLVLATLAQDIDLAAQEGWVRIYPGPGRSKSTERETPVLVPL
jgi:diguanylate cyclase (GGDEF)-like protein